MDLNLIKSQNVKNTLFEMNIFDYAILIDNL